MEFVAARNAWNYPTPPRAVDSLKSNRGKYTIFLSKWKHLGRAALFFVDVLVWTSVMVLHLFLLFYRFLAFPWFVLSSVGLSLWMVFLAQFQLPLYRKQGKPSTVSPRHTCFLTVVPADFTGTNIIYQARANPGRKLFKGTPRGCS